MRRLLGLLLPAALLLAACGVLPTAREAAAPQAATYTSPTTLAPWPTYHRTASRSGHAPSGPTGRLARAWTKPLLGAVYGEPLVVGSTLVVATERDYVYGLNARTGGVRWRAHLGTPQAGSGLPCGNIDPLGITGTPAYDATTRSVFVAAETTGGHHTLWALDVANGARRWSRSLDTQVHRNRLAEQQRAALLVSHGRVVTAFGGLAGDCSNYVGYATSVATNGRGAVYSYAVPTAREAGMWATPGPVQGSNGMLYVASGNGAETNGRWDHSDSVIELTPRTLSPVSIFAPSSWRDDNARDLDLGSSSPVMVPAVKRIVIAGKRGVAYLLGQRFHGVGSAVASLSGCAAFGGAAVVGRTVVMPCRGQYSLRLLHVGASSLRWGWTRPGVYGSPVVAGSHVYVADQRSGDLLVLGLARGQVVGRYHAGSLPHFPSQVVSGDWVFVPTLDGVTAFRGP